MKYELRPAMANKTVGQIPLFSKFSVKWENGNTIEYFKVPEFQDKNDEKRNCVGVDSKTYYWLSLSMETTETTKKETRLDKIPVGGFFSKVYSNNINKIVGHNGKHIYYYEVNSKYSQSLNFYDNWDDVIEWELVEVKI